MSDAQNNAQVVPKSKELPQSTQATGTPQDLLRIALENNADLDKIEKFMDLQERWEAKEARKAFFLALSQFQAAAPVLDKSATVDFTSSKGRTYYKFANLASIAEQIKKPLRDANLSYRFEIKEENASIRVTCVVTHMDGHSEKTDMSAAADNTGNKNAIQAKGSTITYMQRYTLLCALGLTTGDIDTDGNTPPQDVKTISKVQAAAITGLLDKLPDATKAKMLSVYEIERVEDMPLSRFKEASATLNKRVANQEKRKKEEEAANAELEEVL